MPRSLNQITIGGHLGRDAETRHTANGNQITNLNIATTDGWGENKSTSWHRVVTFKKLAEWATDAQKGDYVIVSGSLRDRNWEDKQGNKRTTKEILANEYVNFGGKGGGAPKDPMEPMGDRKAKTADFDDEIPF